MRIWSVHPQYLNAKWLLALWRKTLIAKQVLQGKAKGYRNHPQLNRFKNANKPIDSINQYLSAVYNKALARVYHFESEKITSKLEPAKIPVSTGQWQYETEHLLNKHKIRDKEKFESLCKMKKIVPHPLFKIIDCENEK